MKSISVVIPNFNGRVLLERNLPSIFSALRTSKVDFEVIVSDDASTDDSVLFLKSTYPEIVLVTHSKNSGFSTNINSGLRIAKYDLILALNSDVALDSQYFEPLLPYFNHDDTFGVMGALLDPKTGALTDGAKLAEQSVFGVVRSTKNIVKKGGGTLPSFFLSGANALVNRQKLATLGYFNEVFNPFYNEDVELSLRAWRMGWKCYFEPSAIAYHASSSTIRTLATQDRIRMISLRNRFILHDIHLESGQRFLFFLKLSLDLITRWLTLDWFFYRAFRAYRQIKSSVKTSRQQFKRANPRFSLSQVVKLIRKEQLKSPNQIFS